MSVGGRSILLVDDDQETRELLKTYLSRAGFQVYSVSRGADFRQALYEEEVSLVILDVMLPDEDGFSLCCWIRSHQRLACMSIIMLTASSDEADRVIGLELGADNCSGKSFSPCELLAWIKALLRCAQFTRVRGDDVLVLEDWRLGTTSHWLFHENGEEFFLNGADFTLFKLFLDHPQQILDRDTIANTTRGHEALPLEHIVDMVVSRLRQHLRDTGKASRLTQIVCGSGYLLVAQVRPHLQP